MSLGALLQRGPDHLDLGVVQLGWPSGSRTPPQSRNAACLPHPTPTPHTLGTHPHRPPDLRIRDTLLEQLDRPNATSPPPTAAATKEEDDDPAAKGAG